MPNKIRNTIKLSPRTDMASRPNKIPASQSANQTNQQTFGHRVSQPFNSHLCSSNFFFVCFVFPFIFKVNTFQMHLNYRNGKRNEQKQENRKDVQNNPRISNAWVKMVCLNIRISQKAFLTIFFQKNSCLTYSALSECVSSL